MNDLLQDMFVKVIVSAKSASGRAGAYAYLPEILDYLEHMQENTGALADERIKVARGLGRLVTDDYAFSESPLGTMILELADAYAAR